MFFKDSSRGFEMLEAGAVGVVVMEGAEVKVRGAVLAMLGTVMVRSIVGAGVVVVAGVVTGKGVERETRAGAALTAGAVPNEEVGLGWENRVKEGTGAGVGSDAGGRISGSGKNKDVASSTSFCCIYYSHFKQECKELTRFLQDFLYLAECCFLLHI